MVDDTPLHYVYRKVQHLEAELETFEDKMLLAAQKLDVVRNDGHREPSCFFNIGRTEYSANIPCNQSKDSWILDI